jgi:hypothetical protein
MLNGVLVKHDRPLDRYSYFVNSGDKPEYEKVLVSFIRSYTEKGDIAVIVGGGWGVSTVVTAREVGKTGGVHTYEAGGRQTMYVSETVGRNGVAGRCKVHHAAVGTAVGAFNAPKDADRITGEDLPPADILIIDCDGAEFEVLDTLTDLPQRVIVEHHAVDDRSGEIVVPYEPDRIEQKLIDMGYTVESSSEVDHRLEKNAHWVGVQ